MTKEGIMTLTEDKEIDIFVATKIGSFKHIKYHTDSSKNNKKCIENLVDIKTLQKEDGITCMVWGNPGQTEILLARKNQQIQTYDTLQGFTTTYSADFGTGHVVGLGRCKRKLLAALSSGVVKIWSKKSEDLVEVGKMDRMRVCGDDATLFATGGEENDLKVWRIGEPQPIFTAKNLPHDWLQLRRPLWVSDLAFLRGEGNLLAVCSRHGYVRLYDTRAQRRPVVNVDFTMAATCITPSFDERQVLVDFGRSQLHQVDLRNGRPDKGYKGCTGAVTDIRTVHDGRQVLVGFGRGQLHQVDLRNGRPDKGYKGCTGAVTDIRTVNDGRFIVSTSLDRQIRVHQYESKEMVYRQYLTSKLSCVLVQTESATPLRHQPEAEVKEEDEVGEPEEVADDMDQLFESMETVSEQSRKKKLAAETTEAKKQKPSTEGSTVPEEDSDAIFKLLRSTEKQKKKREKKKKEKKAKSVFHNA